MAKRRPKAHRAAPPRRPAPEPDEREPPRGNTTASDRHIAAQTHDLGAALVVAAVAALIFFSTFSTHVALGDAPESVAGVRSLGVLHAPGYPTYVLFGRAFGQVVAVGSWAFRLNLFSVLCASATVGVTFMIARAFGATRVGAVIGSLMLATTASFWFNAGFAKHYALSGLLIAVSILCVTRWQDGASHGLFVGGALALGLGFGASWELAFITLVALIVLIVVGPRRPPIGLVFGSLAGAGVVAVALLVFVTARAGQHPAVNWGDASNSARLVALITQRDFGDVGGASGGGAAVLGHLPGRIAAYAGMLVRDMGIGAIVLAIAGAVFAWRRLRRDQWIFLVVLAVGNLVAVILVAGFDSLSGFLTVMVVGGFLVATMLAVVVFGALGVDGVAASASRAIAERRAGKRFRSRTDDIARAVWPWVIAGIVVLTLLPSLFVHFAYADHRMPPLADRYAHRMLDTLPPHAVLLTYEADWTFPVTYAQVVDHVRRDVGVIAVKELGLGWYRTQVSQQFPVGNSLRAAPLATQIERLTAVLRARRPVYIDTGVMGLFRGAIGYQADGLVARLVNGVGPHAGQNVGAAAERLHEADRADGILSGTGRFPNQPVHFIYGRAHIELAKQFALQRNLAGASTELARAVADFPADTLTHQVLRYAQQRDTPPSKAFAVIADL
jgi:hypothetical protein